MILINKNATNIVVLTLAERTTLTNVVYLFEFIKDGSTGNPKYFIAQDLSTNKLRYNEFHIIESTTESLLIGRVNLDVADYKYNIYEQVSTTNLSPSGLNKVEEGKVQVKTNAVSLSEFNGQQNTIVSFNG